MENGAVSEDVRSAMSTHLSTGLGVQPPALVPDWSAATTLINALERLSRSRTIEEVQQVVKRAVRAPGSADGATFVLRERDSCFYADEDAIGPLWKKGRPILSRPL